MSSLRPRLTQTYNASYLSVIWSAIALNVTTKLDKINHFTSKRPGNLTALNLTSILYHSQHLKPRESSAGHDQIRNLSYSILSSKVSSVTSVVSSCSGQCSGLKQQPVFRRALKEGDRFSAFYKVRGWLVLGVILTGIIFLLVTHISSRRPPHRFNTYCRKIC